MKRRGFLKVLVAAFVAPLIVAKAIATPAIKIGARAISKACTFFVGPGEDYETIHEAMNAAQAGDTFYVKAQDFEEMRYERKDTSPEGETKSAPEA